MTDQRIQTRGEKLINDTAVNFDPGGKNLHRPALYLQSWAIGSERRLTLFFILIIHACTQTLLQFDDLCKLTLIR